MRHFCSIHTLAHTHTASLGMVLIASLHPSRMEMNQLTLLCHDANANLARWQIYSYRFSHHYKNHT